MEDIQFNGVHSNETPLPLRWEDLKYKLRDVNGNCSILTKPIKIKLVDKHNTIQFINAKVYMTDNKRLANHRDMSLVIVLDNNNS